MDREHDTLLMASTNYHQVEMADWRQAVLANPLAYRVGNSTVRVHMHFVYVVGVAGLLILLFLYFVFPGHRTSPRLTNLIEDDHHVHRSQLLYNATYPLTSVVRSSRGLLYKIVIITDLDKSSKSSDDPNMWLSYLKVGHLTYVPRQRTPQVTLNWSEEMVTLRSPLASGGRGMELSELVVFNGRLYTVDDRTGVIYELENNKPVPWVILNDGNGKETKGFKCEWATVKDQHLYIGGLGKEWTTGSGEILNQNPQWIKVVSTTGEVAHHDWHQYYEKLKDKAGIHSPGYMIHEAVMWSNVHQRWFFLPRRACPDKYNEDADEQKGTNLLITASADFSDIQVRTIGDIIPTHGFSSFKFIPDSDDSIIIALKTEEDKGKINSYYMVFTVTGDILVPETHIGSYKFEGIEFA